MHGSAYNRLTKRESGITQWKSQRYSHVVVPLLQPSRHARSQARIRKATAGQHDRPHACFFCGLRMRPRFFMKR